MTILKKVANKKIILSSAIIGAGILFLAIIHAVSPLVYLSAQQQMVMNSNISTHDSFPKINGSINIGQELEFL